jgi:Cu-Zn family superoxide dismutase
MHRNKLGLIFATTCLLFSLACHKDDGNVPDATTAAGTDQASTTAPAAPAPAPAATPAATATATLQSEDPKVSGTVTITDDGSGGVKIVADVSGAKDGKHGFHVHENGQCEHSDHFKSAGGHFNPGGADHACPPTDPRHAGDLGNIDITGGKGHLEITSTALSLSGPNSVVGKALILHTGEDDCKTQPTGNSGDRLACGVVTQEGGATTAPMTSGSGQ